MTNPIRSNRNASFKLSTYLQYTIVLDSSAPLNGEGTIEAVKPMHQDAPLAGPTTVIVYVLRENQERFEKIIEGVCHEYRAHPCDHIE